MSFKEISFIGTEKVIIIVYRGKRVQFTSEHPDFENLKSALRERDEQTIMELVNPAETLIPEYSGGLFKIVGDKIMDVQTNTEFELRLGRRLIDWAKDGLPFDGLLNFHRKVLKNPSKDSAEDLYAFLEKNKIPITNEGNFIAYKKVKTVNGKLVDCHTGTVCNQVGNIIEMERQDVDQNRNNECSNGFHVAGWDYLSKFSGDTILEVEVDPTDVVAVPIDYNRSKMRTCKYKILGILDANKGERQESFVKVKKKVETKTKVEATIHGVDLHSMTAQNIKDYIFLNYKVEITLDNKNKQAIIKKANKIIAEA